MMLQRGDRVLVTGASGFIGSALVRALLRREVHVVAMIEPGTDVKNLDHLDVERLTADVRDPAVVHKAVEGCRAAFHVAALYRFWARDPSQFYAINVEGTRNVLEAASAAGTERLLYTSTVGTLGVEEAGSGNAVDESSYPDVGHLFGHYKRSKYVAEHEVLRAAAGGLYVSLVLPTFPLGPRDTAPTPTGRLVLDFLNGRIPGYVNTVLNVVHVDDVAEGHVLALERGARGRSYILGGENYTLQRLLTELASETGLKAPTLRVPRLLSLGAAALSEVVEGRIMHRHPSIPLEAARMSTTQMAFDDSRARSEIGYSPRPAREAVADSVRWFVESGYVKADRLAKIDLQ
jgi:dihydroflavonol-4-reductase